MVSEDQGNIIANNFREFFLGWASVCFQEVYFEVGGRFDDNGLLNWNGDDYDQKHRVMIL